MFKCSRASRGAVAMEWAWFASPGRAAAPYLPCHSVPYHPYQTWHCTKLCHTIPNHTREGGCTIPSGILHGPRWFNINIIDFDRRSNMWVHNIQLPGSTLHFPENSILKRKMTLWQTETRPGDLGTLPIFTDLYKEILLITLVEVKK